ncbi:MAG: hypothetical protein VB102_01485 [Paludibacter sp.]|nr:hypothetical protein [Paludibacter sp.]
MIKKMMVSVALLLCGIQMPYAANPGIIPVPQSCVVKKGIFTFDAKTNIYIQPDNAEMRNAVVLIQNLFSESAGFSLDIASRIRPSNIVVCRINKAIKHA